MALFKTFRGQRTDLDNVAKVDGHAYFCMDDGTFWIDYKDNEEVKRKQINKEDWTKDIEAAIAALKLEIEEELVNKTDYLGTVSSIEELSTIAGSGDYHRVSQEFQFGDEVAHVGDLLIALINLPAQTPEYWDLIHTGATVQVDWNQNDKNAVDYIQNRPFYDGIEIIPSKTYAFDGNIEGKEIVTLSEGEYLVKISDDTLTADQLFNGFYEVTIVSENIVETVPITGEMIEIVGGNDADWYIMVDGMTVVSVLNAEEATQDTNFLFPSNGLYVFIVPNEVYMSKVITSEMQLEGFKQIDEKFIPDTIARVEAINELHTKIDTINIPTNYITTDTNQTSLKGEKEWKSGLDTFTFSPVDEGKISSHLRTETSVCETDHLGRPTQCVVKDWENKNFNLDFNNQRLVFSHQKWTSDILEDRQDDLVISSDGIAATHTVVEDQYSPDNENWAIGYNGVIMENRDRAGRNYRKVHFGHYGITYHHVVGEDENGNVTYASGTINYTDIIQPGDAIVFDGGDADAKLAILDETILL